MTHPDGQTSKVLRYLGTALPLKFILHQTEHFIYTAENNVLLIKKLKIYHIQTVISQKKASSSTSIRASILSTTEGRRRTPPSTRTYFMTVLNNEKLFYWNVDI